MSVELADLFALHLAQQGILYDLTYLSDRKRSSERVATFFGHMIDLLPITVTMEIGAHEATFSRAIKRKHPHLAVRAFEANPNVHAHFMFDRELRQLGVEYLHLAIGDRNGAQQFHIYESVMGREEPCDSRRQSCLMRVDSPGASHYPLNVPMTSLDAFCSSDEPENFYALWIDAEGFSKQILSGASTILNRTLAIYIELESVAKFANQAMDREILSYLLDLDFVPILRDFQFQHQYNTIFVKKDWLPQIEQELHRYFQAVLRRELAGSFEIIPKARVSSPISPPPLPRLHFSTTRELKEAMEELPLLRKPADGLDPSRQCVVCHVSELDAAKDFYDKKLSKAPRFFAYGLEEETRHDLPSVEPFARLGPQAEVQLFFKPARMPVKTWFFPLARALNARGIVNYSIERYSISQFWKRNFSSRLTDKDWETALRFFNILQDAQSQYTYLAVCHANAIGNPGYIPLAPYAQYDHPLVHPVPGDIICEGGLDLYEEGQTMVSSTLDIYTRMNGEGKIWAFEPVPATYEKLDALYSNNSNIVLENMALWNKSGKISMSGLNIPVSAFAREAEEGRETFPCVSIDDFFEGREAPTLIKLDVEGSEPEVIRGAKTVLHTAHPQLMVAIYHGRFGPDWITIPELLLKEALSYRYFCGHHTPWFTESDLYAQKNNVG